MWKTKKQTLNEVISSMSAMNIQENICDICEGIYPFTLRGFVFSLMMPVAQMVKTC